jgi:hypothetical protein
MTFHVIYNARSLGVEHFPAAELPNKHNEVNRMTNASEANSYGEPTFHTVFFRASGLLSGLLVIQSCRASSMPRARGSQKTVYAMLR